MYFEEPKLELIMLERKDVIVTSGDVEEGTGIPELDKGEFQ